jgi:glycosyltransferase involved in cell wall biosynthesis
VVLNGIDPERFRRDPARVSRAREALGYEPAHLVVGAVGRLEAQKRFDLLIDAVARLLPDHPSVRLVIAGGGSLFHELQRHAGRVLPDGSWRLLGHTDDVGEVYHAIDVLVQSSDYEGTPNAVLEAMAFETPVVATDVGGTSELAQHGDHALIVPPGRSDLLAEAIVAIVREPAAARARTRAARRRVELDLSFTARMRRVEGIYRELMAARGGRSRPAGMARTA